MLYGELGPVEQALAQKAYALWQENPQHPSLHWKRVAVVIPAKDQPQ
jgi:hypothetical protein